ncbi:MAG: ferritin-like domain-containing protein [Myxococcales bacterium]
MNAVQLAKTFFVAEHVGGAFYDRFSLNVDNQDVAGAFENFARHEHEHARWYAEWLEARGEEVPYGPAYDFLVIPSLNLALAPQPLELKLRTFALTEAAATRHLTDLAQKIRDPELRAIVEKTIPFERMHSRWYEAEGRRMLRRSDR